MCVCSSKDESAPVSYRVAPQGDQWALISAPEFSWAGRGRGGSQSHSSPFGLQRAADKAERLVYHWNKCDWTPVPLYLLGSSFQKMLFEAVLLPGGGEDVRLKAADCPGDWAHWGEALERQQPGHPGAAGACGEDAGCAGASPTGQPLTHVLVNHTHSHEHRKFGKVHGLISSLGRMSCFSEVG